MKAAGWMVVGAVLSWLAAAAIVDRATGTAAFLGMIAPLGAAVLTWIAVQSAHARNPAGVTRVLIIGLAAEMVFFGAYVAVVLTRLHATPVPFVVSFTAYFIGLYAIEAMMLHRLGRRPLTRARESTLE